MIDQYYLYAKTIYTNTYDSRYNITNVKRKREYYGRTGIVKQEERNNSYEYDIYNRLIKEETELGEYIYEYNNNNRISKVYKNGEKIKEYKYNNNLLTKINNDDIIKDSRGNIIRVGNKEYGYNNRGLIESYTKGEERYKYYYNYLGQRNKKERYKKEENEWKLKESKEYYLDEGIIIEENSGEEKLKYYYDKDGVSGIRYKGKNYELIRDILNNVREVVLNGKVIGEYLYDGWGNVEVRLTQGITKEDQYVMENNPYRYRGYYYDKESGLYYCITRYYSPELCIFTSIDSIEYLDCESINGLDLYCYCLNNPIMYVDPSGHFAISLTMLGLIIGAVVGATAGGIAAYNIAKDHGAEGWELFGWTMAGIVGGGVIGGALGAGVGALVTKATGVIGLSITKYSIIPIKGTTVLGNMPGYIAAAKATGSGYYLVSNGTYDKMVEKGVEWVNNMTYIKDAHTLGSKFALVPDYVVQQGRTFWQEIQYLIENGIPWELF